MSSSPKPKRSYTITQKQQILKEHLEHGLSISSISRKHQINAVTLYAWKKMLMGPSKDKKSPEEQAEIEKLRREVEALKKVFKCSRSSIAIYQSSMYGYLSRNLSFTAHGAFWSTPKII